MIFLPLITLIFTNYFSHADFADQADKSDLN